MGFGQRSCGTTLNCIKPLIWPSVHLHSSFCRISNPKQKNTLPLPLTFPRLLYFQQQHHLAFTQPSLVQSNWNPCVSKECSHPLIFLPREPSLSFSSNPIPHKDAFLKEGGSACVMENWLWNHLPKFLWF
jgi:hypothetical protein